MKLNKGKYISYFSSNYEMICMFMCNAISPTFVFLIGFGEINNTKEIVLSDTRDKENIFSGMK